MERVIAVFGIETYFDVILGALMTRKDISYLFAKVAFDFQYEAADALCFVIRFEGQNLLRERKHAAGGLATSNRAKDGDSREQAAFRNREPRRSLGGRRLARVMHFADDKEEFISLTGIGIRGKVSWRDRASRFQSKDVKTRKRG